MNKKLAVAGVGVVMAGTAGLVASQTNAHMRSPVPGINTQVSLSKLCTPGYTRTIRPPQSYTTALKIKQLRQWNYKDQNPSHYEEDHFIPLELGGHPTDPENLFPEPWSEARAKDRDENALHAQVCTHHMGLLDAQHEIVRRWK